MHSGENLLLHLTRSDTLLHYHRPIQLKVILLLSPAAGSFEVGFLTKLRNNR